MVCYVAYITEYLLEHSLYCILLKQIQRMVLDWERVIHSNVSTQFVFQVRWSTCMASTVHLVAALPVTKCTTATEAHTP